jgi:hypothetical protein
MARKSDDMIGFIEAKFDFILIENALEYFDNGLLAGFANFAQNEEAMATFLDTAPKDFASCKFRLARAPAPA